MAKLLLYIITIPIVTWSVDSLNINEIFKKSKDIYLQARIMYMMIVMSMSYLIVNFIYDFIRTFK